MACSVCGGGPAATRTVFEGAYHCAIFVAQGESLPFVGQVSAPGAQHLKRGWYLVSRTKGRFAGRANYHALVSFEKRRRGRVARKCREVEVDALAHLPIGHVERRGSDVFDHDVLWLGGFGVIHDLPEDHHLC